MRYARAVGAAAGVVMWVASALGQAWVAAREGAEKPPEVRRELRGAWVAVVANIDWPSARGLSAEAQRKEMREIVASAAGLKMNALFVQVRPACDAIYPSDLEPWSEFLTGESGKGPTPMYDPLAAWIDECRKAGLEFHAWFNPFRARHFESKLPDAPTHVSNTRPDLVREYGNLEWLDPGEGAAQDHAMRVILDVVNRYDIDGVHIDDYFYPYPDGKTPFPDEASWGKYTAAGGTLTREDWRRDNINRFVRRMYEEIKREKSHVKVGISPFGIWRPGYPKGVEGMDATEKLYADARKWLNEGWMDYVTPQLYWKIEAPKQAYVPLLEWWIGENEAPRGKGRQVWAGNYASRVGANAKRVEGASAGPAKVEWEAGEIVAQIEATRARAGASGNVLFSMIALKENRGGLAETLRAGVYREAAIVPEMGWIEGETPGKAAVTVSEVGGGLDVAWRGGGAARWWVVALRRGGEWETRVLAGGERAMRVEGTGVTAIGVAGVGRNGKRGEWVILKTSSE